MTNNTQETSTGDRETAPSAFGNTTHPGVTEQSFRDLGLDLSPIALEGALARAREIKDSDVALTESRLRDIAADATAGMEALDDVVASFR